MIEGFDLRPGTDDETVWREHFVEDTYRLRRIDVAGWRCLDLGANVGVVALDLLRRGAAHVTAVEPDPGNLDALWRNVALHDVPQGPLGVVEAAVVGDPPTGEDIVGWRHGESSGGGQVDHGSVDVVAAVPIAEVIGDDRWDLMKVDIEGGEYAVLDSVAVLGLLAQVDRIVMEFHGHATGQASAGGAWMRMVADLADEGHVETLGAPDAGGLIWWRRYGVEHRTGWV